MRFNIIKKIGILSSLFIIAFLITSCGGDEAEPAKSLEELQKEQGVPVKVEMLKTEKFEKYLTYFSNVTGKRQTTEGAMVGGRIKAVHAKPGQYVKEGDIIIEYPDDLPSSQIQQAKAAFDNAEKLYKRMNALLKVGETSQLNFDNAETQYTVAKRNYEAAKQTLFVEAPYNGVITEVMVNPGDGRKAEAPLFTIANLSVMKSRIWATSEEIDNIKVGDAAIAVYNDKEFVGKVVEKSMSIDPARQAFYVEIEFDNNNKELRSGITAEIKIKIYESETLVVPSNLVKHDKKGSFIFVEENSVAKKMYIETGKRSGLKMEVVNGLLQGQSIISKGGASLSDGLKLNVLR